MSLKILKKIRGKLYIRDTLTSMLLILAFSLCFLLVCNGIDIGNQISKANKIKLSEQYMVQFPVVYEAIEASENQEVSEESLNKLKIGVGNVLIEEVGLQCGNSFSYKNTTIFLKWTEKISAILETGRYPTEEDRRQAKNMVVIGNAMCPYVEEIKGEKYLKLEGEWYQVVGVLADNTASNTDERIFLFEDCVSDKIKRKAMQEITNSLRQTVLQYQSNQKEGVQEAVSALFEWLETHFEGGFELLESAEEEIEEKNQIGNFIVRFNQIMVVILLLFSISNCIVISNIWIQRRRKEFVIRKAFGASLVYIGKLILKELFQIALGALLVSFIIQEVYYKILDNRGLYSNYRIQELGYIFLGMISCVVLTLFIPMLQIAKIKPAEELRK